MSIQNLVDGLKLVISDVEKLPDDVNFYMAEYNKDVFGTLYGTDCIGTMTSEFIDKFGFVPTGFSNSISSKHYEAKGKYSIVLLFSSKLLMKRKSWADQGYISKSHWLTIACTTREYLVRISAIDSHQTKILT